MRTAGQRQASGSGRHSAAGATAPAHLPARRQQQQRTVAAAGTQQQQGSLNLMEAMEGSQRQDRGNLPRGNGGAEALPEPTAVEPSSSGRSPSVEATAPEQKVPRTLSHALATFFTHPSSLIILSGLAALVHWRAQSPLHPAADAAVVACVAAAWVLQEWAVHALLLHSKFDWMGRQIHVGHHQKPYYHVSIDDPPLVIAFMSASLALFWVGFRGSELALTAAIAYYTMGMLYEYTHYIVHTRYLPTSKLGKRVRMHHLLHHTKNEAYWLAFTVPAVDRLFGTAPAPAGVPMSDMAKRSLRLARRAPRAG